MTQDRLDLISRPNLGRVGRSWGSVTPNDSPPVLNGPVGNTGAGCFGLYVSMSGYVRFITRGHQFVMVAGGQHDVTWLDPTMPVELELGGVRHPVQWLTSVPESVRVYAQDGAYLYGEVVHVMAHDTTATGIFSLSV